MQLLPVVGPPTQRRGGLDEQDLAVSVLAAVHRRSELVGEEPERSLVARGHDGRVPGVSDCNCDGALR